MTRSRDLANLADGVEFLAADHTKLDGIETAATADQTNAEIRTAVEAASDSNVFTDADHSKLNAIEASATADQTNAEIRAAVEAATDSNVFTDADHSKLNAVEASSDVTDTANVTAAGALMDSELTNLAAVKAINQSLVTTATPTFAGSNFSAGINFTANDGIAVNFKESAAITIDSDDNDSSRSFTVRSGASGSTETLIQASEDAGVTLYYDNAAKIATTSTGVNIGGGSSSTYALHVSNDSLQLRLQNTGSGTNGFLDLKANATEASLVANYSSTAIPMIFYTGATERIRVTAAGDFLIGSQSVIDAGAGTQDGFSFSAGDRADFSRNNNPPLDLRRRGNDGAIVNLYKNTGNVGSIGVNSSAYTYITNPQTGGGGVSFGTGSALIPVSNTGAFAGSAKDIGASSVPFRDLYLSGGVRFDATGEFLNDYEEGTWTPAFVNGLAPNGTISSLAGQYTKIGNLVTVYMQVTGSSLNLSGYVRVTGLPFSASSNSASGTYIIGGIAERVHGWTTLSNGTTQWYFSKSATTSATSLRASTTYRV